MTTIDNNMAKHNGNAECENEKLSVDKKALQIFLPGLVFLLACLLVAIVLVYVQLTAAIADLSRRVESGEGRGAEGQGNKDLQDSTKSQHFMGRARRSEFKEKTSGGCESYEMQCRNKNCVNSAFVCDKEDDCGDGSDEENCGMDQCETHLCQNNATCRTTRRDGYSCVCTKGWYGKYCQHNMWQKMRKIRHGKNSGMVSLLSVHIPAKTDTTGSAGAVQMSTGPFKHWRDIPEGRFGLKDGQLEITEPGKYFVYAQIDFDKAEKNDQITYSINKFEDPQLTCVSTMIGSPPRHTCYTAGVLDLEAGDRLVVYVQCKKCDIITDEDTTFWGAVKLSSCRNQKGALNAQLLKIARATSGIVGEGL
ncbi:uncharacterized protein LOC144927208 [Branchiostoma floridae x Branchiostoma belcheri]